MESERHRLDLDGASVAYGVAGNGPRLLFVHGIGLDSRAWAPQVAELSSQFMVLYPDLRGHGQSAADSGTITLSRFVEDMAELLSAAPGDGPAHVCGNSLGALIAVQLAAEHPGLVRSLTLSDGWVYNEATTAGVDEMTARLRSSSMESIAATRVPVVFGPNASAQLIDSSLVIMGTKDFDAYVATSRAMWTADLRGACAHVRAPTLVVVGELDLVSPPERSAELAGAIRGARYQVIADVGHVPNLERADEFNRLLREWLASVDDAEPDR